MQLFFGARAAGRSAEAKYKTLANAWRRRILGPRASMYFWGIFGVALIAVVSAHPSGRWALYAGFVFGAAAVAWVLLPDAVMPHQVFKWQLGAWGEQKTASELRRLQREGWVIRHDVVWGERSNHDHVVAGPAVYVLNSKNLPARQVSITGSTIRVCALDDPSDSYVADGWLPAALREARTLERIARRDVGFAVAVYPVIVVWADFPQRQTYVGEVSLVSGLELVQWLLSRPNDLVNDNKRSQVGEWVNTLPQRRPA